MPMYSDFVSVKRRYTRSVNLERDINIPDSIYGYIPTSRAIDSLSRFLRSVAQPNSVRAWTLTGSYGTGKSAFAHFLTMLCGPHGDPVREKALEILQVADKKNEITKLVDKYINPKGLIRAIATGRREPIAHTITRALYNGAKMYWDIDSGSGRKPYAFHDINDLHYDLTRGRKIDDNILFDLLKEINRKSKSGILLIIDELGKNLEYSAQNQTLDDLYLLQQIAELPDGGNGSNVFLFGLLHQSFVDYAHSLGTEQRKEWAKIQGRFEDIPFIESPERMIQLIGNAIKKSKEDKFQSRVANWTDQWNHALKVHDIFSTIGKDELFSIYPMHPLAAIALPILCSKFSQNDRTLFTFLASEEPNSFATFLKSTNFNEHQSSCLTLSHLYDYFVETAGISFSMRPQFQRWVEIHSRIMDANHLDRDHLDLLKTVGILNLISTTGSLKASMKTIALAMCNFPSDADDKNVSRLLIDDLIKKGFITWRKQIDELRIWEGSDFDIEQEIQKQSQLINIRLAKLLNDYLPLKPLIAQRHSYQTGTLRYFERSYFDDINHLKEISCESNDSDGLIIYWLGNIKEFNEIGGVPQCTNDGRPVLVICANKIKALKIACHEYTALRRIEKGSRKLQSDGVARREVAQRLLFAERILEESLAQTFDITSIEVKCFSIGNREKYNSWRHFQTDLSVILDINYNCGLKLWNELINRRELTSQGAAARHKLISAMIEKEGQERLGLKGNGPECSIFESMLAKTGLYKESEGGWVFSKPNDDTSISNVWKAIEAFCKSATDNSITLDGLYKELSKPPYGAKSGPIPILLLSILQYYRDYISIYLDGNFVPILGTEHFELFYRKPERFAVKYFSITGLRAQLFHELEGVFSKEIDRKASNIRNRTILSVVKPIIGFVKQLPEFTLKTKDAVSKRAISVRRAVLDATEPDALLFKELPRACGFDNLDLSEDSDRKIVRRFRSNLTGALKELLTAYEYLLSDCKNLIYKAFKVSRDADKIREDLRVRASYLHGQVVEDQLRRFILSAINEEDSDTTWLESLVMVIADKPARVWKDKDRIVFENKLFDIARRFNNLEALQKEMSRDTRSGYVARRITVTKPDGKDLSHVVWVDSEQLAKLDCIAQEFFNENEDLIEVLAAILVEKAINKKKNNFKDKSKQESGVRKIGSK
jgi:hypothetical protein